MLQIPWAQTLGRVSFGVSLSKALAPVGPRLVKGHTWNQADTDPVPGKQHVHEIKV